MDNVMTPTEIIDRVKSKLHIKEDVELARYLSVTKQSIYQFRLGKGNTITCKIFTAILQENFADKRYQDMTDK